MGAEIACEAGGAAIAARPAWKSADSYNQIVRRRRATPESQRKQAVVVSVPLAFSERFVPASVMLNSAQVESSA